MNYGILGSEIMQQLRQGPQLTDRVRRYCEGLKLVDASLFESMFGSVLHRLIEDGLVEYSTASGQVPQVISSIRLSKSGDAWVNEHGS